METLRITDRQPVFPQKGRIGFYSVIIARSEVKFTFDSQPLKPFVYYSSIKLGTYTVSVEASHKTYVHSENVMGIQMKGRTVPLFMLLWEEVVETHNWMDLERDMVLDHLADTNPNPTRMWTLAQQLKEAGIASEAEQGGDEEETATQTPLAKPELSSPKEQKDTRAAEHESDSEEPETTYFSSGYASADRLRPSSGGSDLEGKSKSGAPRGQKAPSKVPPPLGGPDPALALTLQVMAYEASVLREMGKQREKVFNIIYDMLGGEAKSMVRDLADPESLTFGQNPKAM